MKYDYYVAILRNGSTPKYVTSIDNETKEFYCENGKKAMKFTKTIAQNLLEGMVSNMITGTILMCPKDCYNLYNETALLTNVSYNIISLLCENSYTEKEIKDECAISDKEFSEIMKNDKELENSIIERITVNLIVYASEKLNYTLTEFCDEVGLNPYQYDDLINKTGIDKPIFIYKNFATN